MKRPELLAPCGNMECLYAAIYAGCDAVYLGGYLFGARSYAGNFSNDEIKEAIKIAHLYGVKVYVTVNTLIYENEVDMFIKYIDFLHKNNVDAIIIQDLGMLDLVRKIYPNLEIHASTQMHIHNTEGVLLASKLGIKRAVIAREVNIEQLKEIKKNTNIELEVFIHGALCFSYSGQCLMSSLIGGRSGNRGTCSQCCRMKYDLISNNKKINDNSYLLSTKDLNTINDIGRLIELGIDSLKIEGRMKRPEYVYIIVSLYRKAIDSYLKNKNINITDEDIKEMKKIFNREFTKGFIFNEDNDKFINTYRPNHMGIEIGKVVDIKNNKVFIKLTEQLNQNDGIRIIGKEDIGFNINKMYIDKKLVSKAFKNNIVNIDVKDKVKIDSVVVKTTDYNQLEQIKENIKKKRRIKITGSIICNLNKNIVFILNDGINEIIYESNIIPEKAINNSITNEQIIKQISKMGNTVYELEDLKIIKDDNIFIKISDLNMIRREACLLLDNKRIYKIKYIKNKYDIKLDDYKYENNVNILIRKEEKLNDINYNYNDIYTDNINLYKKIKTNKILKLPRVIDKYKNYDTNLLVGELGSIYKYNNFMTDFSLNVTNSYTVALLHNLGAKRITLSYELNDKQIEDIITSYHKRYKKHPNLEVIIDSVPEVMISKYKLLDNYNIKEGYLKDSFNNKFKIKQDRLTTIYYYKRIILNNKEFYFKLGINNVRIHV